MNRLSLGNPGEYKLSFRSDSHYGTLALDLADNVYGISYARMPLGEIQL
jgi:hypothetical protein